MGKRDSQGTQDNPLLVIGGIIGVLAIFYFALSISPAALQWQTNWIKSQASVYHAVYPAGMEEEWQFLTDFSNLINQKNPSGKLDTAKARAILKANTKTTATISAAIAGFFIIAASVALVLTEIKKRRKLYSRSENISAPRTSGLSGFIEFMARHLPADKLAWLKANPTPERITAAFEYIRLKKNIPNAIPARLFPPFSEIRLNLLEVGKKNLYDRDAIFNKKQDKEEGNG